MYVAVSSQGAGTREDSLRSGRDLSRSLQARLKSLLAVALALPAGAVCALAVSPPGDQALVAVGSRRTADVMNLGAVLNPAS